MDVAIIDIPWNGIWLGMKIAAMAEAYETNVAPHNFYGNLSTLMSAHFCAAVPNFRVMEIDPDDVPWKDDILSWKPEIINGLVKQIDALRSGAGEDMGIHLDLNFNFKTEGYLQITRALDDLKLTWFEICLLYTSPSPRDRG